MRDPAYPVVRKRDEITLSEQPPKATLNADRFPTTLQTRKSYRANGSVQARGIAAPGGYSDAHGKA